MDPMFAEAELSRLSRPPCVAQYVPSITGLQGSGAAPVGDCANNPVLEAAMNVAAMNANAKYCFKLRSVSISGPIIGLGA